MHKALKDAVDICKTIMRNGYDAYVVNAGLQQELLAEDLAGATEPDDAGEVEVATEMGAPELARLFPEFRPLGKDGYLGTLAQGGTILRFWMADDAEASHPETVVARLTPGLVEKLESRGRQVSLSCPIVPAGKDLYHGFEDFSGGELKLAGLADETLKRDYLLAVRALRFAANYQLTIERNTWTAIVRGARRVLDYCSISDIMDEFRKVEAENLWQFVRYLYDATILHGLIPEVAGLSRIFQAKNDSGEEETVFDHTLRVMRRYPEELPYDWFGTLACLFHDVGKLYTAEWFDGQWHFYQHHRVGSKVTRKILNRLRFSPEDVDLVCYLVRHHMRFHFMLSERGIRRFKALDEYPRLIEMARADIKARDGAYTYFNHNMKYLERADMPEEMSEPLLNGRQIMELTGLKPGPGVGLIRDALLQAQIAGEVTDHEKAVEFVQRHVKHQGLT